MHGSLLVNVLSNTGKISLSIKLTIAPVFPSFNNGVISRDFIIATSTGKLSGINGITLLTHSITP